jgi:hypothetical protein
LGLHGTTAGKAIKNKKISKYAGGKLIFQRPVAQTSFAKIIKSGYKNSNKFLESNRHDGSPTRCTAETLLSFI